MFGKKNQGLQFLAIFLEPYGNGAYKEIDRVTRTTFELGEGDDRLKPPNTFVYNKEYYLFMKEAISHFSKDGLPILYYVVHEAMPAEPLIQNSILAIKAKYGLKGDVFNGLLVTIRKNFIIASAELLYRTFKRGEMKTALESSQKPAQPFDRTSLFLGIFIGAMAGAMIVLVLTIYDPKLLGLVR